MEKMLSRYSEQVYAIARIVVGFLFFCHGAQKILGLFGGMGQDGGTVPLMSMPGAAGLIELIGGALIATGLFTGWAAFICSGEMAAAYFMSHAPRAFWPIENRGELAAIYSFIFLYFVTRGGGIWSLDRLRSKPAAAEQG